MKEFFYKMSYFVLIAILIIIRLPSQIAFLKNKKIKSEDNLFQMFLTFIVIIGNIIFPFFYIFTSFFNWGEFKSLYFLKILGFLIYFFAIGLIFYSERSLGKNWSFFIQIRQNHVLIKNGPYKYIRHPLYLAFFLISFSQMLITSNWFLGLFSILVFSIFYFCRIKKEECQLIDYFGEEYKNYIKKTGRLFLKKNKSKR
jgi:protein-S-isoprenylcysteine O-methyltransferase Ste14